MASVDAEPEEKPEKRSCRRQKRILDGRARSRTIATKRISKETMRLGSLLYPEVLEIERPKTRGECAGACRPCPHVGCKWNLYLDVTEIGSLKHNFPDRRPHEMGESCALDIADRGGETLENVAVIANVTRERIRQIEVTALMQLRSVAPVLGSFEMVDTSDLLGRIVTSNETNRNGTHEEIEGRYEMGKNEEIHNDTNYEYSDGAFDDNDTVDRAVSQKKPAKDDDQPIWISGDEVLKLLSVPGRTAHGNAVSYRKFVKRIDIRKNNHSHGGARYAKQDVLTVIAKRKKRPVKIAKSKTPAKAKKPSKAKSIAVKVSKKPKLRMNEDINAPRAIGHDTAKTAAARKEVDLVEQVHKAAVARVKDDVVSRMQADQRKEDAEEEWTIVEHYSDDIAILADLFDERKIKAVTAMGGVRTAADELVKALKRYKELAEPSKV